MSIENDFLPKKYLKIDTNRDFDTTEKNNEESRNKISGKLKEKITKTTLDDDYANPSQMLDKKESNKVFNFTDSSDENDDNNFFSSPKLSNLNVVLNQHLSIKEKNNETNKNLKKTFSKNVIDKKEKNEKMKSLQKNKDDEIIDENINNSLKINVTKNSRNKEKSKISSPKNNRDTHSKKNEIIKKNNVITKKRKVISSSKSKSRSKSVKKTFKKKIDEKSQNEILIENLKLKEEIKKIKEENKQLKLMLDKEKARTEKFNSLAEEFIKFYE